MADSRNPISTAQPPCADTSWHIDAAGWLAAAEQIHSPNYDERPDADDVSLLIIHNISLPPGEFGTGCVHDLFCNQLDHGAHPFFEEIVGLKVSSHFLIDRLGHLTQFVPTLGRAWHAGVSCYEGREVCNDFSIGIELEGTDDQPYTDVQYARLQQLTRAIMERHPRITAARITGHEHIAPGRKTDPGPAFDWERYLESIKTV